MHSCKKQTEVRQHVPSAISVILSKKEEMESYYLLLRTLNEMKQRAQS